MRIVIPDHIKPRGEFQDVSRAVTSAARRLTFLIACAQDGKCSIFGQPCKITMCPRVAYQEAVIASREYEHLRCGIEVYHSDLHLLHPYDTVSHAGIISGSAHEAIIYLIGELLCYISAETSDLAWAFPDETSDSPECSIFVDRWPLIAAGIREGDISLSTTISLTEMVKTERRRLLEAWMRQDALRTLVHW